MSLWARLRAWPPWVWPAAIVVVCFAVQLPAAMMPLWLDDAFEVPRALSDDWREFLFVYNYDAPNAQEPWWFGQLYQKRVVRILPSALLSAELRIFGRNALALHLMSLAAVVATLVLVQRLLARWIDDPPAAALATLVLAVHPVTTEMVGLLMMRAIIISGLAGVIAVVFWDRLRRTGSKRALVGAVIAVFVAVTSYEGALFLPIAIAGTDAWLFRKRPDVPGGTWLPRLALLGVLVVYAPIVVWVQQGVVHPDYEAMRPFDVVFHALRIDSEAYLAKTFLLFDPTEPWSYWFLNRVGEVPAVLILAVPVVGLLFAAEDRRLRWIGLVAFAGFLGPPLVTRAAVSLMNTPTLRQIYLPILFGLVPILAAVLSRRRGRPWVFAAVGVFAILAAVQSIRFSTEAKLVQSAKRIDDALREVLAGQDTRKTLVVAGDNRCGYHPNLVWPGPVVRAFPGPKKPGDLVLVAVDDYTLEARSAGGFNRTLLDTTAKWPPMTTRYNQGSMRTTRQPNFTRERTVLVTPGATIELVARTDDAPTVLRARIETKVSDAVIVNLLGCDERPVLLQVRPER